MQQEPKQVLPWARRATQLHPEKAEAWALLAKALARDEGAYEEREAALTKAVQLDREDAVSLHALAWSLAVRGEYVRALPYSLRAVRLAVDSDSLDTLAVVRMGLGRCDEAAATQRRAIEMLPENVSAQRAKCFADRLKSILTSCKPATSTASQP